MKELSIEEKAKAYDEAKEKAKIWQKHLYDVNDKDYADELNYIFPALKESEDGQHRKWILEYLYDGLRKSNEQFKGQFKAAITWFEKQGEQNTWKPSDEQMKALYDSIPEMVMVISEREMLLNSLYKDLSKLREG